MKSLAILGVHHDIYFDWNFDNWAGNADLESIFDTLNHLLVNIEVGLRS